MAADLLDLGLVVRRLAADARTGLPADAVAVWLLGADGSELALHAALGFEQRSTASTLAHRPFHRLGAWLTPRRPPSVVAVPTSLSSGRTWLAQESIRSLLAVPLVAGSIRLGLLAAFRRRRPFTERHLAHARAIATASAPTIHAALRFAAARDHVARADILLAVTQTLAGTTDLIAALRNVSQRTAAALGAERCEIELAETPAAPPPTARRTVGDLVVPIGREYR